MTLDLVSPLFTRSSTVEATSAAAAWWTLIIITPIRVVFQSRSVARAATATASTVFTWAVDITCSSVVAAAATAIVLVIASQAYAVEEIGFRLRYLIILLFRNLLGQYHIFSHYGLLKDNPVPAFGNDHFWQIFAIAAVAWLAYIWLKRDPTKR